jgi:hypothetical protein
VLFGENGDVERGRDRWKPVLLSGLVFPGLGQLVMGRVWRGLAFGGGSVVFLVLLVKRVMSEASRLAPQDPVELLDPALPFRLAAEIQRANAGFFLFVTLAILALWAGSMADAWWGGSGPR